jgi:CubicO group peptidase (beta-lactamase class C family)
MPSRPKKLLAVLVLLASFAHADEVDHAVNHIMQQYKMPGAAIAVMREGKIVRAQGYGLANVELNVPVHPETIFQSGSMGKEFTATAIMMLVEEGKIALDDKITRYFPDSPATWNDITIRRLLTHTSGIKNYSQHDINFRLDYSEDDLLKKAQSFPLDFTPGDKWSYSNTGYVVLGVLIHKVTGEFYGDFLQERIFHPLGMTSTRIMSEADIIPNRSSGYRLVKGQLKNQEYVSPTLNTTADGSLYFTVLDLAKWDAALYTEKLLKRSSLDQMWTPVQLNNGKTYDYGFGWFLNQIRGHKIIEHGGAWQGFTTHISRYVDDKLTVVTLSNLDSAHSHAEEMAHVVAGTYIADLKPLPPPKAIEDKEPAVTQRLSDLIAGLAQGKVKHEDLVGDAARNLSAENMKDYGDFFDDMGPAQKLELLERKGEDNLRTYRYRVTFERQTQILFFKLDQRDKIADFGLE